ncbi:signal peptidase II [Sphaerisporangium rubeum]|uniref:Lipoprotein signal peptidase n=1 Tax=Sphaerisporangium rubeum TaxID=321317 RepID=A0A7X0IGF9_9ACTN|nr:signal peptidase II [Sphaerisporangium rubeum]
MQATGGAPLNDPAAGSAGDAGASDAGATGEPAVVRRGARRMGLLVAVAVAVYVLDLISKTVVVSVLEGGDPVTVISEVLRLRVIRNPGAAFSIGTGMTVIFTVIAAIVVVAILRTARRLRSLPWALTLGLLLGGALGNLTDRVFRAPAPLQGHVVDWIEVFPATGFPVFNVADSAIVCGGIIAVFLAWRGYQMDGTRAGAETEPSGTSPGRPAAGGGDAGSGESHG